VLVNVLFMVHCNPTSVLGIVADLGGCNRWNVFCYLENSCWFEIVVFVALIVLILLGCCCCCVCCAMSVVGCAAVLYRILPTPVYEALCCCLKMASSATFVGPIMLDAADRSLKSGKSADKRSRHARKHDREMQDIWERVEEQQRAIERAFRASESARSRPFEQGHAFDRPPMAPPIDEYYSPRARNPDHRQW